MSNGVVFNIQRFSIHDGPGIRITVFLKGCPLRCWWCHNPESLRSLSKDYSCVRRNGPFSEREMTTGQVMTEIEKEIIFFDQSSGGVTFSGGDPLVQSEFLLELLGACQRHEIHSAVDTTGYAPREVVQAVAEKTDLFLYDLKLMDAAAHEKFTGVSNEVILDNLRWLASSSLKRIIIRFPVVPGYTDGADNISAMADFLTPLGAVREIHLLPYHKAAAYKYERLGEENKMAGVEPPSAEALRAIQTAFEQRGFQPQIGG